MPNSKHTILSAVVALVAVALAPAGVRDARATDGLPGARIAQADDAYRPRDSYRRDDAYRPDGAYRPGGTRKDDAYRPEDGRGGDAYAREPYAADDAYRPEADPGGAVPDDDGAYRPRGGRDVYRPAAPRDSGGNGEPYTAPRDSGGYGQPYAPPRESHGPPYEGPPGRHAEDDGPPGSYSQNEILGAGHRFFGSVSQGLASAVEYAFGKAGRPNGYILGEDAGGALIAGLRYGEGTLHTKDAGHHKVYWQGPSLGYDFGAAGSKTMVLVYNLRDPSEIYNRFAGVEGSAYLVGGVSIQFQQYGHVVLAPIRSGLGLRLGANLGYLKYTRSPTWNPF